jgi:phage tail-like protein
MTTTALVKARTRDLKWLEDVVRISYPVREALTYLNRHLGNPVGYRLVEALRGERPGHIRSIEVIPASGGEAIYIRAIRVLPDGSPATYFTPDELVTVETEVVTPDGRPPGPLGPKDRILLHVPVKGYLRYLPGLYQGAVPAQRRDIVRADEVSARRWGQRDSVQTTEVQSFNADALRRFLFLFQHLMTTVTDRVDQLPQLIDPHATDPRFLSWIASWVDFELDSSLPLHQQRELTRRAIRLYRTRGTVAGVEEMIRVLTAAPVKVAECAPPSPFVLGRSRLAGGATVEERYTRGEPSCSFVMEPGRAPTSYFSLVLEPQARFRERFGERATSVLRRIAQIVSHEKPSHVTFTIRFAENE